jgi:hypothetical protein
MHEPFLRKCPICGTVKLVTDHELAMAGLLREEDRHPYLPEQCYYGYDDWRMKRTEE